LHAERLSFARGFCVNGNAMKMLSLLLVAFFAFSGDSRGAVRPNVVVFLADDQGWGDLGVSGNTNLRTPNIDGIGVAGAVFEHFFVCPVCSPTRAEFLTGRYHPRGGVFSTSTGGERLDLDERTLGEVFRAAGYATGAFGKWHNGMQYPYHPNGRGFDEFYGFCSGHWGDYFSPPLDHNGALVMGNGYMTDDFTDKAMDFIGKNVAEGKPFVAYLPYNTPHAPMQVPDRWWDSLKNKELALRSREGDKEDVNFTRAALAMSENIDWNVGRVMARLDELGIEDDTIVVYFSDNGPNSFRWNGGMKGKKGSTDEGGVRSPLLVRWPGTIPAGRRVSQIAGAIDLLPTLVNLCGIAMPEGKPLDGVDLRPLLVGEAGDWPERMIFSHWNGKVSARSQAFRLDDGGRLYDMAADPGQARDVARENAGTAKAMGEAVTTWRREVLGELRKNARRPFPLGSEDFRYTQLPARDAVPKGGLQRSSIHPNCSFLTHWTSVEDAATWDVEVGAAGRYAVELYYTCAAEDVGATLELTLGKSVLRARISEAHDPPLQGEEHDRAQRTESLVKDFRALPMGTMSLQAGAGELKLRASEIPGKSAMDFRLLMFTGEADND
jgi:arylsulfatase A-like enzyme